MPRLIFELSKSLAEKIAPNGGEDHVFVVDQLDLYQTRDSNGNMLIGVAAYSTSNTEPVKGEAGEKLGSFRTASERVVEGMTSSIREWSGPKPIDKPSGGAPANKPEIPECDVLYKPHPSTFEIRIPRYDKSVEIKKIHSIEYYDGGTSPKKLMPDDVIAGDDPRIYEGKFLDFETEKEVTAKAITLEVDPIRNEGKRQRAVRLVPVT